MWKKIQNSEISKKLQEKIISDNLLTSLQLDIEFPSGGYFTKDLTCEIREESQQLHYIKDKVVCFTMNKINDDAYSCIEFPFEVVSVYTNSEDLPTTKCYVRSVKCY